MKTECICGCGQALPRRLGRGRGQFKWSLPGHVSASIRQLAAGEAVPLSEPRRYKNSSGYVRLRWRLPDLSYVEAYEHRIVAGVVGTATQVHHRNKDKADNRTSNLERVDATAHAQRHGAERRKFDTAKAVELHASGLGMRLIGAALGVNPVTVLRRLRKAGVPMRPRGRNHHKDITGKVLRPVDGTQKEDAATVSFERVR
jgi:hypothetical protein